MWTRTSEWWAPFEAYPPACGTPPVSVGGWRFEATDLATGGAFVLEVVATTEPCGSVVRIDE
ncbi:MULTISPECIES: hypothetical protein [unclassified Rathayibacter]|uniref:hypothetical protein n=1 Tax=unclassified Rathayibacter TaxID=2609250 RepID=UPI00188BEDEA|nr:MULTISPECIES: hypothetical protein [unclassified Rathayibacter]MBF4462093.1 hypothetical protein [Rathayibacter sp. VKM Ac-2879]MBF4503864.1 hypothetical protein [Rathayibacter sp. VKM Ac-2878]